MHRHMTILGLALALALPLGAQSPPTQRITVDDAVGIALRQNVTLRQAENSASLSEAQVAQQKLQFLPNLSLSTGTSHNLGRSFDQTSGSLVTETSQSMNAGLSSSVTLFDGLRNLTELRQARFGEDAAQQEVARARQTVVFTVASNFLSLVAQQEQLRVREENLAALELTEQQIARFVQAGTRAVADLYQQQASVASARAAVVSARRALELAKVDLIQTLQLDPAGTYDFVAPTVTADAGAAVPALDDLLARAFASRADLDAEQARVDAAEQGVKAAAAGRWPTVSLSLGYNTAFNSAAAESLVDQFDQRRGGSIGVGISIPLFDRGSTSLASQQAQLRAEDARLALAQQRQTIALEIRRARLDLQSAQEQLAAAEAQQRAADLAVSATEERYRVGAATLVELTQARAAQVEAASALVNARYDLAFQQRLVGYYTGELEVGEVRLGE